VVSKITDPIVKSFWITEYARYTQRYEIEATAAIQNKVGQFISNPLIRNIIGQTKSTINMRDIMDEEKIFIMDLSKGRIGEDNSRLLGALLITKLQLGAMSRVDVPEEDRKDFYLYVDEFQNFATESFANILSEARKYRLNITLGHQYIGQLAADNSTKMRDAVFGNVGTLAVFRVGAEDAEFLEREFTPEFTAIDLVNLPKYNVYLKLMIDGVSGHPFSAETLPPPMPLESSNREKIIKASRERYGVKKEIVDEKISRWSGFGTEDEAGNKIIGSNRDKPRVQGSFQGNSAPQRGPQGYPFQQSAPQGRPQADGQTTLYDAICSDCGKPTKVIFPPEKGRAVYCKSCLKKMKTGETRQKPEGHFDPLRQSSSEASGPATIPDKRDLGGIESVSFHNPKPDKSQGHFDGPATISPKASLGGNQVKPKRKEINLSELRKALEESLGNKDKQEKEQPKENTEEAKTKSSEEELKERIEQERYEDKAVEEKPEEPKLDDKKIFQLTQDKKPLNPGETVKL
jgi:CxxC-x17-CxxC domain-containing protein